MVLEVPRRGAVGSRIIRNDRIVFICIVLEVGWRGAAGLRIIRNS